MICARCGEEFEGRKRKFCSKECCRIAHGQNPYYKPETHCLSCGKPLNKGQKKYCSGACCSRAYYRRKNPDAVAIDKYIKNAKSQSAKRNGRICKQCGKFFIKHRGGNKTDGSGSFCKRKCWGAWRSVHITKVNGYYPGSNCKVWFKKCDECGGLFTTKIFNKKTCSLKCDRICKNKKYAKYQRKIYKPKQKAPQVCADCGNSFMGFSNQRFCPEPSGCRKRYYNYFNKKAESRVSLELIFHRDKGRCHICGKKLSLKDKVPKYHAPTRDHVIPISKGGGDSAVNIKLACFICNSLKGNRKTERGEQLLMFG